VEKIRQSALVALVEVMNWSKLGLQPLLALSEMAESRAALIVESRKDSR
jgi:hypothetical protein